ncbi:hypothetical protein H6G17_27655 [Chroococcidiopsis sp. FACHB-1243]|uniref:hypothetical protein n=1 Tax=Chroococcidiopsis sp. [FACHB-1243] TaxID=2692781 RepID=UPI00177ECB59|nr:hypothetical protein [Chroococcidiopsis sp. [FACHB-1243]]MBD2309238.1 hypothetical protein [Chroococcidiopsis sp. [FACHB-1243]]
MSISKQGKIIALWIVFLFGTVFHTQLALMPLLYGENVMMPDTQGKMPAFESWLMLGMFVLPAIAIVVTAFNNSRRYRFIHFCVTVLFTVINFIHIVFDLSVQSIVWHQIVSIVFLFVNGLLLNIVSLQWLRERDKSPKLRKKVTVKAVKNS